MTGPIQTTQDEDIWWSNLIGDEVDHNLHGNPPYDVASVAERIVAACLYPGRILDMGCGVGRLTNHIARELDTSSVLGFDISSPSVAAATLDSPANALYWHSDGRTIPAGITGVFDLIYSVTMFQHIPHDAKWAYICQAADRIRPGGAFVVTVAVGDEPPTFLNHQLSEKELDEFCLAMTDLFATVSVDGPDDNGWTWLEARV